MQMHSSLEIEGTYRTYPEPPLCKGRWHGAAVTEGLSLVLEDNPSVSFADSSLYTREPWARCASHPEGGTRP